MNAVIGDAVNDIELFSYEEDMEMTTSFNIPPISHEMTLS